MKKGILTAIIVIATSTVGFSQSLKKETFGVRGNCGMCESKIEAAAISIKGVEKADWDTETKQMTLSYNKNLMNIMSVHKAIAKTGYDTELISAKKEDYDQLHGCCQYDRNMKIKEEK